ncbi:DNA recombination protein RmuC [Methylocapsa acidiphila]|uniref:DNA recombination protein RmuC n=1 Tax=Methylocapsa acidiphila TaxID=133552 RepID=UPI0003FDDE1C|nr:DNA recombination protein RmuC [Methylocapsa acidiphila]
MERILFILNGAPIRVSDAILGAAGFAIVLLAILVLGRGARGRSSPEAAERQRALERGMVEITRQNAELAGRMRSVAEILGSRQADLARLVSERLDAVGARVGTGLEASSKTAGEHLSRLNERLAVIDAAQTRLAGLTEEVVGLKEILGNKQARGAFGQGRLEAIIRDALPERAYAFQYTLSNRTRPDCVIRLPGDPRLMVIDAKFPLESFTALKEAAGEDARKQAAARVRIDVAKHIHDIAERYFIPQETQDVALLFIPSESLYADLNEYFEDIVQKAHRRNIVFVSPSLLMMAVQVIQAITRDARVREEAHVIQAEARRLIEEVARLKTKVAKLDAHFKNAGDDVGQILASIERIARTGERIDRMDFAEPDPAEGAERLKAAE